MARSELQRNSRRSERSGSSERRKKRPTARPKKSDNARQRPRQLLKMEAPTPKDLMALLPHPTPAHGLFSCLPSATNLLSTRLHHRRFLNSHFPITTTAICTPTTSLTRPMRNLARAFLTNQTARNPQATEVDGQARIKVLEEESHQKSGWKRNTRCTILELPCCH